MSIPLLFVASPPAVLSFRALAAVQQDHMAILRQCLAEKPAARGVYTLCHAERRAQARHWVSCAALWQPLP